MSETETPQEVKNELGVEQTSKPQPSFWIGVLFLGFAYFFFQVYPLLGTNPDGTYKSNQNDFKHIYLGAQIMSEGASPYDQELMLSLAGTNKFEDHRFNSILPYVYLPFTGIVLMPLSWLSFNQAATLFQLINHACLIGGLFLLVLAHRRKWDWKTACIIFLPVIFNWCVYRSHNAGQLNSILFFGACLLYFMLLRNVKAHWLGLTAAFLMLFKITPGIFLIWFLLTKRYRVAAWMVGWAILLTIIAVFIVGFQTHLDFFPVLSNMGMGKSTWENLGHTFWRDPSNQSINSFLHNLVLPDFKLLYDEATRRFIHPEAYEYTEENLNGLTILFAVLLLLIYSGLHRSKKKTPEKSETSSPKPFLIFDQLSFSAAILLALLTPSIMWDHYLLQGLLPAFVLWQVSKSEILSSLTKNFCKTMVIIFWILTSVGMIHESVTLHLSTFGNALGLPVFIPLPGSETWLGNIWMSLKLWPTLLMFFTLLFLIRKLNPPKRNQSIFNSQKKRLEDNDWRELLSKNTFDSKR